MFLRNPFDRLVSCWADKIAREKKGGTAHLVQVGYKVGMTFTQFVEHCIKNRDRDVHTKAQIFFYPTQSEVNFWGTVENLESDWLRFQTVYPGTLGDLPLKNRSPRVRDWRGYYNYELYQAVKELYFADLAMWCAVTGRYFDDAKMANFFTANRQKTRGRAA